MTDKITLSPEVWKKAFNSSLCQQTLTLLSQVFKRNFGLYDYKDMLGKEWFNLRLSQEEPFVPFPFCELIYSASEEGKRRCAQAEAQSTKRILTSGQIDISICHAGLMEVSIPIMFQGKYYGCISPGGGFLLNEPNEVEFNQITERVKDLGVNLDQLKKAYFEITPTPKYLLEVMFRLLGIIVEEIIRVAVETEADKKRIAELENALTEKYRFTNIIGQSKPILEIFRLVEEVIETDSPILIQGETGTGKELVARAIHYNSSRKDNPFIPQNCAALSETLLESELFGHIKGSFTGAINDKRGLFELANNGTLFLDEIGEMSPGMQAKLLRAIEQGEFRPVGSEKTISVNVRIISATNKDIKTLVSEGKFREDLYYRLQGFTIILPPLRERKEDIPLLVNHFLKKIDERKEMKAKRSEVPMNIGEEALRLLMDYNWPGNVRQLETEIERTVTLSKSRGIITPEVLSSELKKSIPHIEPSDVWNHLVGKNFQEVERELFRRTLEKTNWNQTAAARILKIPKSTFHYKIQIYGLDKNRK